MQGNSQKHNSQSLPCKRYRRCPHDSDRPSARGEPKCPGRQFRVLGSSRPWISHILQHHDAKNISRFLRRTPTVTFRVHFHTAMLFLLLIIIAHITVAHTSLQAEDWSIRKINPFGSRPRPQEKSSDEKPQAQKKKPAEVAEDDDTMARPLTAVEIRRSFSRIGQETAAAFSKTRAALTPEFQWFRWEPPQIRFPRLRPEAPSEPGVPAEVVSQKK